MPFWSMHWGWGWWWFPFHGLISAIFIVAIVLIIATAVRPRRSARSTALDLLEQRYARGEIQREEYLEKKRDLGG